MDCFIFFFTFLTAFLKKLNMPDIGGRTTETEVNSIYAYKWVLFFCQAVSVGKWVNGVKKWVQFDLLLLWLSLMHHRVHITLVLRVSAGVLIFLSFVLSVFLHLCFFFLLHVWEPAYGHWEGSLLSWVSLSLGFCAWALKSLYFLWY